METANKHKEGKGEPCTLINILKATGYLFVVAPFKIVFYITGKMIEAYISISLAKLIPL